MRYAEDVHASRPFAATALIVTLAAIAGGVWLMVGTDQGVAGPLLFLVGVSLTVLVSVFRVLRIEVDYDVLHARFGLWGINISADQIEAVHVVRYQWLRYGGWGLRWGSHEGRWGRACSVPFLSTGVVVDTREGRRHFVNSRRPEQLAAAVNLLAEEAGRS